MKKKIVGLFIAAVVAVNFIAPPWYASKNSELASLVVNVIFPEAMEFCSVFDSELLTTLRSRMVFEPACAAGGAIKFTATTAAMNNPTIFFFIESLNSFCFNA
jgi:formate/nitrite transporter FocA (FNT family)